MNEQDWLIYGETKYSRIFQIASISYIFTYNAVSSAYTVYVYTFNLMKQN